MKSPFEKLRDDLCQAYSDWRDDYDQDKWTQAMAKAYQDFRMATGETP